MRVQRGGILMKFWRKKSIFEDSLFWEIFFYWIICFIKLGVVEWMCWNESNCVFKGD